MDEDNNQDELINRSKGKRPAQWVISDSDDDVGEESEEGESDEEDQLDGEENEGEEEDDEESDEEDDDEEDEDAKPEDGAVGGTSADLAGMSSEEDEEICSICLNSFSSQPVATPETCEHYFCLDCILEWAKNANSCPVDRLAFNSIYLRKCYGGKVLKMITVQKPVKEGQEETVDLDLEQTNCEVCGGSDREDRLLLCDGCDAGYHMECLTPPLDSVPVEEWFCPQCEANNRHSRDLTEEVSDAESLPSTTRAATSQRNQGRATGPTRAIARTQQSERVRANVNRHRITQARSSQLAPTYLIQSTWLDETINAVVAGLNTAVYVRDLTPRLRRTRKTVKRRRVKSKKTSSAKGKTGKSASTRVKRRRRRRVRRTKSRTKQMVKKTAGPRDRIASNLGLVKDKRSSSLPTVYRPSEHTLSNMRADIGAASLSIYGDPFDLDPFVEREENEHQVHVTSLLEAKRRGISRSALRSHQPVARPVTASLSRGGMDVPRSGGGVVEAAPVPDLLGSILSGQSMLLMDSSDVIINRDGSLKSAKLTVTPSTEKPSSSKCSSSGDVDAHINPGMSPNQGDALHYNRDLPGSSHDSINRPLSQSTAHSPPFTSSSVIHTKPPPYPDLPPRGHQRLQPPCPVRPTISSVHHETNPLGAPQEMSSSSIHHVTDPKSKGTLSYQTQPKKAPTKPMWVDVAVLPRIPKIKRESSSVTNDTTGQDDSNRISGSKGNSSGSMCRNNNYGMPKMGMNILAGDKGRQQIVDQQKGRVDGQTPRHRSGGASSSPAFSNSFSSSSSTDLPAAQSHCSSSSSSAVSFRINSSGNSWQSRRLNIASSSVSGGNVQDLWKRREDEAKKRRLHRDKQMLLASRTPLKKEQDVNNIYDPFNPTVSDSSSSDDENESSSQHKCFQQVTQKGPSKPPRSGHIQDLVHNKQDLTCVKMEIQDTEVSQEQPRRASSLETISQEAKCSEEYVKDKKESIVVDIKVEKQPLLDTKIKIEPGLDDISEAERLSLNMYLNSETPDATQPGHHTLGLIKTEKDTQVNECVQNEKTCKMTSITSRNESSASSSIPSKKKHMTESKSASTSSSKSPSRDLGQKKKTSKSSTEQHSSSSERGRRGDHHTSDQSSRQKEKDKDNERGLRRSRSRERRRARSTSQSSLSSSPGRSHKKRRRSRSRDRKQSRSGSRSSSREYSRKKKHIQRNKERNDSRETDHKKGCMSKDKRHGQPRSKSRSRSRSPSRSKDIKHSRSRSKSRSRSRSRERRKDQTQLQKPSPSHRDKVGSQPKERRRRSSRSSSRERRKQESKSSQKTAASLTSSSKDKTQLQDKKKEKEGIQSSVKGKHVTKWNKHELPSPTSISTVKKEEKDLKADEKTTTEVTRREMKVEIKKEKKSSLDVFEDSTITKIFKKEEIDVFSLSEAKSIDEEIKEEHIKTETCEIAIKSEQSSPKLSHLPASTSLSILPTPVTAECLQDAASQPHSELMASEEKPSAAGMTVPVKQEVLQPSDSDDDFSVDVMLDDLDYVKSERAEGGDAFVKQEKVMEEGKHEGAQALAGVGVKSKTQVKRVTWNIQEPEVPQSEKSASKVALYKLKRRQEGARRPSSMVHTSSQEMTGAVSDSSKKGSKSADLHPEGLSVTEQGEAEEGDKLSKDKYLKKLHMQERAVEEVKLAIKPFYQRRDINKDEYKEILRKAVQKVCHSKSGEINPVKVGNLVKAYVDKYKHARKHKKGEESEKAPDVNTEAIKVSDST